MPTDGPAPTAQPSGEEHEEAIDFLLITAPKGKPVVEFWRNNRKYPELRWHLGGEALLKIAPELETAGWTASHFDAIGEQYPAELVATWVQSPKNEKWRDVIEVRFRA